MRRYLPGLLAFFALATACAPSGVGSDAGGSDPPGSVCSRETRADTYVAGLTKRVGEIEIRISAATPAPPGTGENAWSVSIVTAATGAPLEGAALELVPFMPDHGHGSAVKPTVTSTAPGRFDVKKVYFAMAGLWKVTFVVRLASGEIREAAFNFCLDG